jgi:hypothetical protein
MPIRFTGLLCGGIMLVSAASAAAAGPINVRVRVEGKKTLVAQRTVTLADAPVIKDGNPAHSCPGQSALGALQQGTQGDWDGSWSEGLGYFVKTIKSETPKDPGFFQLWVNHKESTLGFCSALLKASDDVLVFEQTCTYNPDTQACPDDVTPLGVTAPKLLKAGHKGHVVVVSYDASGKAKPRRGATVFANGKKLGKTDKHGSIAVAGTKAGRVDVYATETGYVRSEVETLRVRK